MRDIERALPEREAGLLREMDSAIAAADGRYRRLRIVGIGLLLLGLVLVSVAGWL
ncbi:MAG: hypothetical protein M3322_11370 [Actinomycetota bacterium]|nr:hypothetical protein [Actinomycetota bacterium]